MRSDWPNIRLDRLRAALLVLLFCGGQLAGWLHVLGHLHAEKHSTLHAETVVAAPAAAAEGEPEDDCLVCLGLATLATALLTRWPGLPALRRSTQPPVAVPCGLARTHCLAPTSRGPPVFS